MIDHGEMQKKKIGLFILDGVTGGVSPYRIRKVERRHIRFESGELCGYFLEDARRGKGANEFHIFRNASSPIFRNDEIRLRASRYRPMDQCGSKTRLTRELPQSRHTNIFCVPTVTTIVLVQRVPGRIGEDSVR